MEESGENAGNGQEMIRVGDSKRQQLTREKKIAYCLIVIGLFIIFVVSILLASWNRLPEKYEIEIEDGTVGLNESETYSTTTVNNDYIKCDLQVTQGGPVDVYIIRGSEISNYRDGKEFAPVFARENVTQAHGEIHVVTFASHTIVIDNQDNARDSDAVPEGPVNYTLTYSVHDPHWWESMSMWEGMLWVIGIAFVICVLAVYMIVTDGIPASETERMKLVGARKPPPPLHKHDSDISSEDDTKDQ